MKKIGVLYGRENTFPGALVAKINELGAGEFTAESLLNELLDCASTLEHFPDRGSVPSELAQLGIRGFRQLIFQTYRLIYRVTGGSVFVHVIADGRRDMQQLLERRLLGQ